MAAQYTYLAADLLTNTIIGEAPLHGVTFDRQLSKVGNWQGSANLDNDLMDNDTLLAATEPGRTAMYVYRGDQIVWGGIIWSRTYQSQAKSLQMTGQTFESYAYKRIHRLSSVVNYNQTQCSIIRALWGILQFQYASCDIGVNLPEEEDLPSPDIVRQPSLKPWDFKSYGEIIDDLMNFDDSADYTIECYEENGVPLKMLSLGYPRLGAYVDYTGLVLDYPGNILNYYWSESATDSGNQAWATGDGDEGAVKVGLATNQTSMDSGYPLMEIHTQHPGVTVQATINKHAVSDLAASPLPKIGKTIQIKADEQPEFGTYNIGDDAKLMIMDTRFPDPGVEAVVRAIGWSVVPSSSENTEEVTLVLAGEETVV
jgi:hypothetical protein